MTTKLHKDKNGHPDFSLFFEFKYKIVFSYASSKLNAKSVSNFISTFDLLKISVKAGNLFCVIDSFSFPKKPTTLFFFFCIISSAAVFAAYPLVAAPAVRTLKQRFLEEAELLC